MYVYVYAYLNVFVHVYVFVICTHACRYRCYVFGLWLRAATGSDDRSNVGPEPYVGSLVPRMGP